MSRRPNWKNLGGRWHDDWEQYLWGLSTHVKQSFPVNGVPADLAEALAVALTDCGRAMERLARVCKDHEDVLSED